METKKYIVRTKGKPKFVGGIYRYSEGQVLEFKVETAEKTGWIKTAIKNGNLEEVGVAKTSASPIKETTQEPAPVKKASRKSRKKVEEPKVEEPKVEEVVTEEVKEEVVAEEPKAEEPKTDSE